MPRRDWGGAGERCGNVDTAFPGEPEAPVGTKNWGRRCAGGASAVCSRVFRLVLFSSLFFYWKLAETGLPFSH